MVKGTVRVHKQVNVNMSLFLGFYYHMDENFNNPVFQIVFAYLLAKTHADQVCFSMILKPNILLSGLKKWGTVI